jgi:hypothetical protein
MPELDEQQKLEEIRRLQKALIRYSDRLNNKRYEDKTPLEQEIDDITNSLHMHLEKYKRRLKGNQPEEQETSAADRLASKMLRTSTALRSGSIKIGEDIIDELDQITDLVNLSNTAKTAAKDTAVRRKLKELEG